MSQRTVHVKRPAVPKYPQFKGDEPCTEIGFEPYFYEEFSSTERKVMKEACDRCPILAECGEWALRRERWGYWAGMGESERHAIRSKLNIFIDEPQFAVLPRQEVVFGEREAKTA